MTMIPRFEEWCKRVCNLIFLPSLFIIVQRVLKQSLLDMELLHKQEELEQIELEQALAISLAIEEERLRLLELQVEADFENEYYFEQKGDESQAVMLTYAPHSTWHLFAL